MTLEEHSQLHEQWLRSMESHHCPARRRSGDAFEAAMAPYPTTITMNLPAVTEILARSGTRHDQIEEAHLKLSQEMATLRDLIERYIRFRGNGSEM